MRWIVAGRDLLDTGKDVTGYQVFLVIRDAVNHWRFIQQYKDRVMTAINI